MAKTDAPNFGKSELSSMRNTGRSKHLKFGFDGKMEAKTPNGAKIIGRYGNDLSKPDTRTRSDRRLAKRLWK